jgi:hypothetical protein
MSMNEPDNLNGVVEQAFNAAGQAVTTALDAVGRLRDLAGIDGPAAGYLRRCIFRLDEALSNLGLARICLKATRASRAAGEQLVLIQ